MPYNRSNFNISRLSCRVIALKQGDHADSSIETVIFSAGVSLGQLIIMLAVFWCMLRSRYTSALFSPLSRKRRSARFQKCLDYCSMQVAPEICLDGRVLIRFCGLGIKFSFLGTVVACALIPLFANGKGNQSGFLRYTVSNLSASSPQQFWWVVLAAYFLTGTMIVLMWSEWHSYTTAKRRHFVRKARGEFGVSAAQAQFSVLVEMVPKDKQTPELLRQCLEQLFGEIHSCVLHGNLGGAIDRNLQRAVRVPLSLRNTLEKHIMDEEFLPPPLLLASSSSTAFVTFMRARDRLIAEQVDLFDINRSEQTDYGVMVVMPAPEARDIVWENAAVPLNQLQFRTWLSGAICCLGLLVWSIPVTFIQTSVSRANLMKWMPHTSKWMWQHSKVLCNFIVKYLPVLGLLILLVVLPYALELLIRKFEGHKMRSRIMCAVLRRNLRFQLATLWVSVFAGSLVDSFQDIVDHPVCISYILGRSIPKVSAYYTSFVMARIGVSLPLLLLRGQAFLSCLRLSSPSSAYCDYATEATNMTIVLILGLTYALVTPAILPLCMLYFGLASTIYHWLFVNVYEQEFDAEGSFWPDLFNGAMIGLLFGILSVCGLAGMYAGHGSPQQMVMFLLPMIIIVSQLQLNHHFAKFSSSMAYQDAVEADEDRSIKVVNRFDSEYYVDPNAWSDSDEASSSSGESTFKFQVC